MSAGAMDKREIEEVDIDGSFLFASEEELESVEEQMYVELIGEHELHLKVAHEGNNII
jgi:hypothetical protein